jgi:hypothetical protein
MPAHIILIQLTILISGEAHKLWNSLLRRKRQGQYLCTLLYADSQMLMRYRHDKLATDFSLYFTQYWWNVQYDNFGYEKLWRAETSLHLEQKC